MSSLLYSIDDKVENIRVSCHLNYQLDFRFYLYNANTHTQANSVLV